MNDEDIKKMHFKDYRSGQLTNGIERSAHRALLYSTGMDKEDLKKPMIAVVNSLTEMVPGHYHLKELADFVKLGIAEAGGIAREFSTIAICDGICQGHKGMSSEPQHLPLKPKQHDRHKLWRHSGHKPYPFLAHASVSGIVEQGQCGFSQNVHTQRRVVFSGSRRVFSKYYV